MAQKRKRVQRHRNGVNPRNNFVDAYVKPGLILLAVILVIIVIAVCVIRKPNGRSIRLNQDVLGHTEVIEKYAEEYGIKEYVPLIQAVMMQESRGRGSDPMQASACMYNTKYDNEPGAIEEPEYSIEVGVQYLKHCLEKAECKNPGDLDRIRLALQGYNYGSGYISWAVESYGGYTQENAVEFSEMMKEKHGTKGYGDTEYVSHVLRFYTYN